MCKLLTMLTFKEVIAYQLSADYVIILQLHCTEISHCQLIYLSKRANIRCGSESDVNISTSSVAASCSC